MVKWFQCATNNDRRKCALSVKAKEHMPDRLPLIHVSVSCFAV